MKRTHATTPEPDDKGLSGGVLLTSWQLSAIRQIHSLGRKRLMAVAGFPFLHVPVLLLKCSRAARSLPSPGLAIRRARMTAYLPAGM